MSGNGNVAIGHSTFRPMSGTGNIAFGNPAVIPGGRWVAIRDSSSTYAEHVARVARRDRYLRERRR